QSLVPSPKELAPQKPGKNMKHLTTLPHAPVADDSSPTEQAKIPHEQIDQLLQEIADQKVREMVSEAFSTLLNLLQDVPELAKSKPVGGKDGHDDVIERFRQEANSLIDYLGGLVSFSEGLNQELSETLDGI